MKTRFCPSPTGYMHLGNLRTALFSFLYAKAQEGQFLLRIEDTDKERSSENYTDAIMKDLKWLNMMWDEGPEKDLGNGPYWQSERQAIYDEYYKKLETLGLVYPCFCSEQELTISRKVQLASGKPPRYAGTCRHLTQKQVDEKISKGIVPTLRFKIPENITVELLDLVKGLMKYETNDLGDFIIRRTDGTAPFIFCNAIDDALMGVTHVIRGADHVSNTPRQIMVLDALGLRKPEYAHISLITSIDGGKLSKRHGSDSIADMRANGILPGALVNYLGRLGHYYEDNNYMTISELASKFKIELLSKSPAKFDDEQLMHWQKLAVHHLDKETFWDWMGDQARSKIPSEKKELFIEAIKSNVVFPDEVIYWADIFFHHIPELNEEKKTILKEAGEKFFIEALKAVGEFNNDAKLVINHLKNTLNIKGSKLFLPIRVALTGETFGPEIAYIFQILGKEKVRQRLMK